MTTLKTAAEVAREIAAKVWIAESNARLLGADMFDATASVIQQFLTEQLQAQHEKTWETAKAILDQHIKDRCKDVWIEGTTYMSQSAVKEVRIMFSAIPCPPINESTNNG